MKFKPSLFILIVLLGLSVAFVSGCGDDDDGSGGDDNGDDDDDDNNTDQSFEQICASRETEEASDYSGICEGACEVIEACEGDNNCVESCRLLTWEWNDEFANAFQDCLGGEVCTDGQIVAPCMQEVLTNTQVGSDVEATCADLASKGLELCQDITDVSGFESDMDGFCLSLGGMMTSDGFNNLADCLNEDACDSFMDCLDTTSCVIPFTEE